MATMVQEASLEPVGSGLAPVSDGWLPAGTVVIHEGDPGDRYYAIARGELDVVKNDAVVVTRSRRTAFGLPLVV